MLIDNFAPMARRRISRPRRTRRSLRNAISFRVLLLINLITKPFFTRYATRFDLSLNEWRLMVALAERPGISASEAAAMVGMHEMNVSRAVRRLARMGRIRRGTDPTDRRRSSLELTPAGYAIYDKVAPGASRRDAQLRAAMAPQDARDFIRILDKLNATLARMANGD